MGIVDFTREEDQYKFQFKTVNKTLGLHTMEFSYLHYDFYTWVSLSFALQDHRTVSSTVKSGKPPWFCSGSLPSTQDGLQSVATLWT